MEKISIRQSELTEECWLIQLQGLDACKRCEYKDTPECSGKDIIATLKNSKGYDIPLKNRG